MKFTHIFPLLVIITLLLGAAGCRNKAEEEEFTPGSKIKSVKTLDQTETQKAQQKMKEDEEKYPVRKPAVDNTTDPSKEKSVTLPPAPVIPKPVPPAGSR